MKYLISYKIPNEPEESSHVRYYDALDKDTAIQMFEATCEESLVGEEPQILNIKKIDKEDGS